jgi:hypothetical protein
MGKCSEELPARHKGERGIIAGVFWRVCTPKRSLGIRKQEASEAWELRKREASEAWE